MGHIEKLQELLLKSADHINEHGHHQFDMWEGKACCIMGAPRMVDNESSYSHIARDVLAQLGYDEKWNDKPDRTKEEVVDALILSAGAINPKLLSETYGSNWREVLDYIVQVDKWTKEDYTLIESEEESSSNDYTISSPQYLNGLASFLTTVMTSGHTTNSAPFKAQFDTKFKG